jgi:hypothetical protein
MWRTAVLRRGYCIEPLPEWLQPCLNGGRSAGIGKFRQHVGYRFSRNMRRCSTANRTQFLPKLCDLIRVNTLSHNRGPTAKKDRKSNRAAVIHEACVKCVMTL